MCVKIVKNLHRKKSDLVSDQEKNFSKKLFCLIILAYLCEHTSFLTSLMQIKIEIFITQYTKDLFKKQLRTKRTCMKNIVFNVVWYLNILTNKFQDVLKQIKMVSQSTKKFFWMCLLSFQDTWFHLRKHILFVQFEDSKLLQHYGLNSHVLLLN